MDHYNDKKSLRGQTLPAIPLEPRKPLGLFNAILLLAFGVALGIAWGLTQRAQAAQAATVYEHLTNDDRAQLTGLISSLEGLK